MYKKVYIRVDGGNSIGLGHLVRCIALAQMLDPHFGIQFVCKEVPVEIQNDILKLNFEIDNIESEENFISKVTGNEIIVLDHYGLDSIYQKRLKKIGSKLVCIDDLHDKEFFADLIINHAPGIKHEDYQAQLYTEYALGLDYALLRPIFLESDIKNKLLVSDNSIFICFGGSDRLNLTKTALQAVLAIGSYTLINVVVGNAYSFFDDLQQFIKGNNNIILHKGISANRMALLMKNSSSAILPCSGILLEALSLNLKIISGKYVTNQEYVYQNYKNAGAFLDAKDFSYDNIANALKNLDLVTTSNELKIDRKSPERILRLFQSFQLESKIRLREANLSDLNITYSWTNDSAVRKFSFNKGQIGLKEHTNWFIAKLSNNKCIFFIAEIEEEAIGTIRFDVVGNEAIISYLVAPKFHGQGLGKILLKQGVDLLLGCDIEVKNVIGYVMNENIASIRAFEKLGYTVFPDGNEGNMKFIKKMK